MSIIAAYFNFCWHIVCSYFQFQLAVNCIYIKTDPNRSILPESMCLPKVGEGAAIYVHSV